jgi:Cu/Ag efflux pump CusA
VTRKLAPWFFALSLILAASPNLWMTLQPQNEQAADQETSADREEEIARVSVSRNLRSRNRKHVLTNARPAASAETQFPPASVVTWISTYQNQRSRHNLHQLHHVFRI